MTALLALIPRWVLAALLLAAVVFSGVQTYRLVDARSDVLEARERVASMEVAIAQANTEAANKSAALQSQVVKAQNEAKKRETDLRAAAAAAGSESDGLRDDLTAMRVQIGQLSRDAAVERASAIGVVLAECSRRYQSLAEIADRHTNDLRTLIDAWPR